MENDNSDNSAFSGSRAIARRMHRSDSIPEHSETTPGASSTADASIEELLMRHSSPLFNRRTGEAVTSPLAERNSSPSPMRLNRPRSNPRSRTPMRIPEHEEDVQEEIVGSAAESRRITIRLGSGSAIGSNTVSYTSRRTHHDQPARVRSSKQGPSHRKARRWNNDNFVNLAAELSAGKGNTASAVEALLKGSAEAAKHRSVLDPKLHESKAMKQFREDKSLRLVREQFFDGSLPCDIHTSTSSSKRKVVVDDALTSLERFHRIETRLRRIVVKACENSFAASKVVNTLEKFLAQVYSGEEDTCSTEEWKEFLLEPPVVTASKKKKKDDEEEPSTGKIIKFCFDADSSTGGFHRLLLHGVCQFHSLKATSSTSRINGKKARVLTATGNFSGGNVRLVDFITERQKNSSNGVDTGSSLSPSHPEVLTSKLSALKV